MVAMIALSLFGTAALVVPSVAVPAPAKRDVDTRFPYTGPEVPIGDWVDATVNGNGKGFIRLVEVRDDATIRRSHMLTCAQGPAVQPGMQPCLLNLAITRY
jgi:hypothetical protein